MSVAGAEEVGVRYDGSSAVKSKTKTNRQLSCANSHTEPCNQLCGGRALAYLDIRASSSVRQKSTATERREMETAILTVVPLWCGPVEHFKLAAVSRSFRDGLHADTFLWVDACERILLPLHHEQFRDCKHSINGTQQPEANPPTILVASVKYLHDSPRRATVPFVVP